MHEPVTADLQQSYPSATVEEVEQQLAEFETQWSEADRLLPRYGSATGAVSFRSSMTLRKIANYGKQSRR
ncbi:MAG: hypothetical protein ACXV8Q_00360 [Methylobacter sp.]